MVASRARRARCGWKISTSASASASAAPCSAAKVPAARVVGSGAFAGPPALGGPSRVGAVWRPWRGAAAVSSPPFQETAAGSAGRPIRRVPDRPAAQVRPGRCVEPGSRCNRFGSAAGRSPGPSARCLSRRHGRAGRTGTAVVHQRERCPRAGVAGQHPPGGFTTRHRHDTRGSPRSRPCAATRWIRAT